MKSARNLSPTTCLIILLGVASGTYLLYAPALSGELNFDDAPNLHALSSIIDIPTALTFVFSGNAGPLARPIALASFALQFYEWPHSPQSFINTNILIHLINGLLVCWLGLRLARLRSELSPHAVPFALTMHTIWLLQPILASASLMIVQRMATLSATFVLLGLIGYLAGRERIAEGRRWGWPLLLGSLGIATTLASLSKETGMLLPVYVWVLEFTLLAPLATNRMFQVWKILLHVPIGALLVYMALQIPHVMQITSRGYSALQRLITEGPILWTYVRLIFLPQATSLGPFHDDIPVPESVSESAVALLAWSAWGILIGVAVLLRPRLPWVSFAVGWFLLGHSLESSIFNLEPYFEHRNYLPSLGPIAWVGTLPWLAPTMFRRAAVGAATAYMLLLGFVLHEVTAAWGNPQLAARLWADHHPNSERAQQFLAQRYVVHGDYYHALSIIDDTYRRTPANVGLALQSIQVSCALKQDVSHKINEIQPSLASARMSNSVLETLRILLDVQQTGKCSGLDPHGMHRLIDSLLANPYYRDTRNASFNLHHYKARLYFASRELDPAVRHLEQAFEAQPDLDTAVLMIGFLRSAGLEDEALKKLDSFKQWLPLNPVLRQQWEKKLGRIESDIARPAKGV